MPARALKGASNTAVLGLQAGGLGQWQLGFASLFTLAANCPRLKELSISEEQLVVRCPALVAAEHCPWAGSTFLVAAAELCL